MTEPDPFMEMAAAAVAQKQLFDAFIAAGFSERQAISLLVEIVLRQMQEAAKT